ncbi:hypothetical protein ACFOWB_25280 [Chenggangzhangella methanolivorans]
MVPNVDLFADVAAALLIKLHAAFPIPLDIEIDVLADKGLPDADPSGATREAFVEASLLWLASAGLIAFEPGQLGARMVERVGLTARGFLALQASDRGDDAIGLSLGAAFSAEHRRDLIGLALAAAR